MGEFSTMGRAGPELLSPRGFGDFAVQGALWREPPSFIFAEPSATTPPTAAELIRERGKLLVELQRNLERAQQRIRESANKHCRHVEFAVGYRVLLQLQPYRKHSVARPQ